MIWHDPQNRGWEDNKAYRWNLQYSTDAACMRYVVLEDKVNFDMTCGIGNVKCTFMGRAS